MMQYSADDIHSIDRAKIKHAQRMTFEERFFAGADLFEYACSIARDGIRMQFPEASESAIEEILRARLARARRRERAE